MVSGSGGGGALPLSLPPAAPAPSLSPEGRGDLRVQGYAAVFDRVDRAGDVVRAGAFADAGVVPLLWQHRGSPVGEICAIGEDATGLWIEAEVTSPEVARLVRSGALRGLSVGYRALAARQGAWREIRRAALLEVSLVAVPMQAAARVTAVISR
jgi:HK97 family phage prohead protease